MPALETTGAASEGAGTDDAALPLPSALTVSNSRSNVARMELESILTALNYLPDRTESNPDRLAERAREKEIVKRRLDNLYQESEEFRQALDAAVEEFNGVVGNAASFDLLDALRPPSLSPRLLARGGRGDQLSPLL
jgi:hypothetical protein